MQALLPNSEDILMGLILQFRQKKKNKVTNIREMGNFNTGILRLIIAQDPCKLNLAFHVPG
jgi:hypothetical protein